MKYKEITIQLLKKLHDKQLIKCRDKKRYETCKWNKKVKYNDNLIVTNWEILDKICAKCLLKDIENVIKE